MNNVQSFLLSNQPAGNYTINGGVNSPFKGSNGGVLGGTYAASFSATGAGTAQWMMLGPDGVTWLAASNPITATSNLQVLALAPGTYQLQVTGFTQVYASLTRIPN